MKYTDTLSNDVINQPFSFENCYFLEINSMPTIEPYDGFDLAYKAVQDNPNHSFYKCVMEYVNSISKPTINGFLLACSMLSLSTSKY